MTPTLIKDAIYEDENGTAYEYAGMQYYNGGLRCFRFIEVFQAGTIDIPATRANLQSIKAGKLHGLD